MSPPPCVDAPVLPQPNNAGRTLIWGTYNVRLRFTGKGGRPSFTLHSSL